MAEAGIKYVRIGEFAWSKLEPSPGDLRFDWLVQSMDALGRHGLKVIVGTPTATPPRWMVDKHPDMLAVDKDGGSAASDRAATTISRISAIERNARGSRSS